MAKYIFEKRNRRDTYTSISFTAEIEISDNKVKVLRFLDISSKNEFGFDTIVLSLFHLRGTYHGCFIKKEFRDKVEGALCVPEKLAEEFLFTNMDPKKSFSVNLFFNPIFKDIEFKIDGEEIPLMSKKFNLDSIKEELSKYIPSNMYYDIHEENKNFTDLEENIKERLFEYHSRMAIRCN